MKITYYRFVTQHASQYEWSAEGRTISFTMSEDGSVEARDLESGDT